MQLHLTPEIEEKLRQLASEKGRGPEQFVQEIVQSYLDHDQWFRREVQKGIAQLDVGDFVEHGEVAERLEQMFRAR